MDCSTTQRIIRLESILVRETFSGKGRKLTRNFLGRWNLKIYRGSQKFLQKVCPFLLSYRQKPQFFTNFSLLMVRQVKLTNFIIVVLLDLLRYKFLINLNFSGTLSTLHKFTPSYSCTIHPPVYFLLLSNFYWRSICLTNYSLNLFIFMYSIPLEKLVLFRRH